MKFSEIPGNKEIVKKLIRTVNEGRVSHALLFTGPEGCGSLALAMAFAQYISCENRGELDSCGECKSCKKYRKLVHPDYHFVFPVIKSKNSLETVSDNFIDKWRELIGKSPFISINDWHNALNVGNSQGQIYVDEASAIMKKMGLKPYESDYKIMIIWLPERMHPGTANKLLKLIEEPPEKTLFFLVSDNPDKLLPTILSRCQIVKIQAFEESEIRNYLVSELEVDSVNAGDYAHIANGNISMAIELAGATSGSLAQNLEWFMTIMRMAYGRKIIAVINWAEEIAAAGRERQKYFLGYAIRLIRENLMLTMDQEKNHLVFLDRDEADFSAKFHPFIHEGNVYSLYEEFNLAYSHIETNGNAKVIFLDLGLRIVKLIR